MIFGPKRSLAKQLARRLIILQTAILLAVLAVIFLNGNLFSFRSTEWTIETLRLAIDKDDKGALSIRQTPDFQRLRNAEPDLWFVVSRENGDHVSWGSVPSAYKDLAGRFGGIGQARFGATIDDTVLDQPNARMRTVQSPAGRIQVLTGTRSDASAYAVFIGIALVLFKVGLPIWLTICLGVLLATPLVVKGAVAGIVKAEKQASLIDIGKRGVRLHVEGAPPEISSLIQAVNEALLRLDEGYEKYQRFLAAAAHELRTPIAILATRISSLPPTKDKNQLRLDVVRLENLAEQLLDLERLTQKSAPLIDIDLNRLTRHVAREIAPLALSSGYDIEFQECEGQLPIKGDPAALERALMSLIQNAIDHGGNKGRISVAVRQPCTVEIRDEGPGVPVGEEERIFEPFSGSSQGRVEPGWVYTWCGRSSKDITAPCARRPVARDAPQACASGSISRRPGPSAPYR